jgi:phosphate transport system substrate-binding protein
VDRGLTALPRLGVAMLLLASILVLAPRRAYAAAGIVGSGSSFAGIEMQEWSKDVGAPPYGLNVNYQSSSSGQGRQNFKDGVVDFAVTDIRYNKYDVSPPDPSTFEYVPVTAGGVAIMYNLKAHGFSETSTPLNLSSLTLCGIFTAAIVYWDDPAIGADNPGVALPHVPITPVVRSDPAGTNYVMQEYCIQLHNDLYSKFAAAVTKATGTDYPDEPTSTWPIIPPLVAAQGSEGAADTVAGSSNDGYVTAVETGYATQRHFPVAAVKNDTGAYVTPTPDAVATALSYATQLPDGTHVLNFTPGNTGAYNPSTYSYFLFRLAGESTDKGATITQFAEYCLTIGESHATQLSYASIGKNLIQFGLQRLQAIAGYVPPTAAELAAIPSDNTIGSANGTTDSSSSSSGASTTPGATSGSGPTSNAAGTAATGQSATAAASRTTGSSAGTSTAARTAATTSRTAAGATAGVARTSGAGAAASIDPSASLGAATGPLGQTGIESDILASAGTFLLVGGEVGRRVTRRRRRWRQT